MNAKKFWLERFLPIAIIVTSIGAAVASAVIYAKGKDGSRTPLGWCVWEIHHEEDYDCEFTYTYQELEPKSEIKKEADKGMNLYCYYITVFTDDRIGEWYCFIECFHKDLFDKMLDSKYYSANEVYLIDCDIAREDIFDERIY